MKKFGVMFYIRGECKGGFFIFSDNAENAAELVERLYPDINYILEEY